MGWPGAVEIKRVMIIERLGGLENASLEIFQFVLAHQAGQVHDFPFRADLVLFDFGTKRPQDGGYAGRIFAAFFRHEAIKGPAQLNFVVLRRFSATPEQLIAKQAKLGMDIDEEFKNVGDIPINAQAHLYLTFDAFQLL